jgi:hypothetical protein
MTLGKLMGGLLLVAAMPAMADTAASIWQEEEDGKLRLDDGALGTWCYAKDSQLKQRIKDATFYERNRNCYRRVPPDWIVFGPTRYSTMNRECSMMKIAHAEYHKNVVVTYRCVQYGEQYPKGTGSPKRDWVEQIEMGFTSDDYLYITPSKAPSR